MAAGNGLIGYTDSEAAAAVRRERINKGLEKMPLSYFDVAGWRILRRFIERRNCSEEDLAFLEGKIEEYIEHNPLYCSQCGTRLATSPNHRC